MTQFLLLLSYLLKYEAIKNHPKVVDVARWTGFLLAKCECQDSRII